jgi:ribonuclease HII
MMKDCVPKNWASFLVVVVCLIFIQDFDLCQGGNNNVQVCFTVRQGHTSFAAMGVSGGVKKNAGRDDAERRNRISLKVIRTTRMQLTLAAAQHNHHKRKTKVKNSDIGLCAVEAALQTERGYRHVLGSDESGRGAIAGPLVAATCCLLVPNLAEAIASATTTTKSFEPITNVKDSKLLTHDECLDIYNTMLERPDEYAWNSCVISASEIDDTNVQQANMDAFRRSIEGLVEKYDFLPAETYSIVDGKKSPKLSPELNGVLKSRPWVRGDVEVYTVALASIVAKVTRDNIMLHQAHEEYPQYHFDENGGYPSQAHLQSIHQHGPCLAWHRQSVKPVQQRHIK